MPNSSTLRGVIGRLLNGDGLDEEQISELERLLAGLQRQGWSGMIPADEALAAIVKERDEAERR